MSIGDIVSRNYNSFRGIDARGDEVNLMRSPASVNMWKDYRNIDSVRTRPKLIDYLSFNAPIWGIFTYKVGTTEMMLVHSGTTLYRVDNGTDKTVLYTGLNPRKSKSFIYNNIWYFKDGINYLQYDGSEAKEVVGYVPTTTIGRKPSGGGTTYEDVNMLSSIRINTFLSDGESTEYFLDALSIDTDYQVLVAVNTVQLDTSEYTVDESLGKVTFKTAPEAPLTDGQDNVKIQFRKTVDGYKNRINQCTLLEVFDNRVFFSGNPDYPNTVWHCALNDPTYCSDLDYYNEGLDLARVKALVAGNNALWVFKEPSQANTTVFYHTPTIDSEYGKIYPSSHSSISTGCVGAGINFNDDIAFFSDRGMEAINGDIMSEQVIAHRSSLIDSWLTDEPNYSDMILEEWEGYLLVFVDSCVYLADSRAVFTNENHIEYEWFYWELDSEYINHVTSTIVKDSLLYIGFENGKICYINPFSPYHNDENIYSSWITPIDKFKSPSNLKTTNKRGFVIEGEGDFDLYVKTNTMDDWELIKSFTNITDYATCKIKKKKFKDLQICVQSMKTFSLESIALECYIGGYIKR